MMAAGLRREEAASLQFEDVKKQNEHTVLDVGGKRAKDRVVPISDRLADAILDWQFLYGVHPRVPARTALFCVAGAEQGARREHQHHGAVQHHAESRRIDREA